ncbi:MAG: prepilin-type N-terminal cleavage/methylation domain-containing protein [Desulfosalsimonadaceae bacterium]
MSHRRGFTLIEFSIVMAILGILAAIAVPALFDYLYKARVANTVCELKSIEMDVISYNMDNGGLPPSLKEVGWADAADPWGNSYVYVPVDSVPKGKLRKDKFLVPVNTDFDLYSPGRDGKSRAPFTAKSSRDDVVRANNGDYFGLVEGY